MLLLLLVGVVVWRMVVMGGPMCTVTSSRRWRVMTVIGKNRRTVEMWIDIVVKRHPMEHIPATSRTTTNGTSAVGSGCSGHKGSIVAAAL